MDAQKFAEAYPVELPPSKIRGGKHSRFMYEAQDYSYKWGLTLHTALGNAAIDPFMGEREENQYCNWLDKDLGATEHDVMNAPAEIAGGGLNELNFHLLNNRMRWLWKPIRTGKWDSPAERSMAIDKVQDFLALDGLKAYIEREKFVQKNGGVHALYTPQGGMMHETYTGMIQEYDDAIIGTEMLRNQPNWSIVPAPAQFEHSEHGSGKRKNVDFVLMDFVDKRAVGIQGKSMLQQADFDEADPDRVVFIDGNIDLNNIKVVRPLKDKSTEISAAWPGIVAATKVADIKSHGRHGHYLRRGRTLPELKFIARGLVGKLRVDHQELAARIESRIRQKL